ncbi:MAG: glycosyltransferase [Chloroflexota bacterium]
MKVCQAFTQLGHEVTLIVPETPGFFESQPDMMAHYGLTTPFTIDSLPVRSRRLFPWIAVFKARSLRTGILYVWPPQSAVLGLLARLPVMLEMHDLPSGWLGPLWYRGFLILPGKKRLLPITQALKDALDERFHVRLPDEQVTIAPDGVDLERYDSLLDPEIVRRDLNLPLAPTVLCTGHLYAGRGAELFLGLAAKFPQASFVWVGGRPRDVEFWSTQASERKISNITFTGFIPNQHIPHYQAAADVLLMPYGRTVSASSGGNTADVCSPMKMFEYMAAGRAILTSDLPVLHEILDETMAVFCPPEDPSLWESELKMLLGDPKRRITLGQRARSASTQYSWLERAKRILENFNT